jgi:photosystem II stability/assembly factor-like uncharacterized protein
VVWAPPGSMDLFVPDQAASGMGWRILGGAPELPGPPYRGPAVDLYVAAGVEKPLAYLGLPLEGGFVDPTNDVVAVADIEVAKDETHGACGRIRFEGVTIGSADGGKPAITLRYQDAPEKAAQCGALTAPARFIVALTIDQLPSGPFSLLLQRGKTTLAERAHVSAPEPAADDRAAIVDAAGSFPKGGLWIRQRRTLWMSWDAAEPWLSARLPAATIALSVIDPATIWVVTVGADSVWPYTGQGSADTLHLVVRGSSDSGATWQATSLEGNFGGLQPVIRFVDLLHGYLLLAPYRGGPASRVLVTSDGGASWQDGPIIEPPPAALGDRFTIGPDGALWAGSQGDAGPVDRAILAVSRDGGSSWTDAGLPGLVNDVAPGDSVVVAPQFFGERGVVAVARTRGSGALRTYTTDDAGSTWTEARNPDGRLGASAFTALDQSLWVVARSTGMATTRDAGRSWQDLESRGLPAGSPSWLGFTDPNRGLVVIDIKLPQGGTSSRLYATRDGGASWEPLVLTTP